jgi:hypothetical protein
MQIGRAAEVEVRIARDRIAGFINSLDGRAMGQRGDDHAARALTVRLKAPDAGFWIESGSPETQWLEPTQGLAPDDYAVWRWTVVPQRRGRSRLLLQVSARTLGRDGLAAESAPPDRVIEVRVRANYRQGLMRWAGWIIAMLLGALLARLVQGALDSGWLGALSKFMRG